MADQTIFYLSLDPELRTLLGEANKLLERVLFYQKYGHPLELYSYLRLKFHDVTTTQAVRTRVIEFAHVRDKLGYGVWQQSEDVLRRAGIDPNAVSPALAVRLASVDGESDNVLKVHYDSFVPKEYRLFLEDVAKTHLHFFPVASSLALSLKHFLQTYTSLEIIRLLPFSFEPRTNAYSEEDIALLHSALLALARRMIPTLLTQRPVHITIDGNTAKLAVSVDGFAKKLSPTQTKGIVALALLPYDHWFPIDDFYRLIHASPKDDDARDFGAALDVFKKEHRPFGWEVDDILRRVNGAIIEPLVDETVLRVYLDRRKKP